MNYAESLQYLSRLQSLGVKPGTDRLAEVLRRLDSPENRCLALHIAGTNGKGSTAAFSAALLLQAAETYGQGHKLARIGLYTSPHLSRVRERIKLSDEVPQAPAQLRDASEAEFAWALSRVEAAAARFPAVELSFFEVLTAAAFVLFAEQKVEVAVIETGLGGRLDATRLCAAGVTVVTSIGLDHTEILGPTLSDIAREKAGIFRSGVPAIVACDDDTARAVLCAAATQVGAPLWLYEHRGEPCAKPLLPLPEELWARVPLLGAHQHRNAALALAAVAALPHPLAAVTQERAKVEKGLQATRWPGRLERLWPSDMATCEAIFSRIGAIPQPRSEVLIDAAHNPEGSQALARYLDAVGGQRPLTVLFGIVAGKDAAAMGEPLRKARRVFLTRPPSPRGLAAEELHAILMGPSVSPPLPAPLEIADDFQKALRAALNATPPEGLLLIYGSIFLIGAVRALWFGEACDPLAVQDPPSKSSFSKA